MVATDYITLDKTYVMD